jgi:hypothetical protein
MVNTEFVLERYLSWIGSCGEQVDISNDGGLGTGRSGQSLQVETHTMDIDWDIWLVCNDGLASQLEAIYSGI